ncbi:hypothetical protein [Cyclobacterium marinum]|uniref:Lipoprotein n=1 Tax=Cyclobacterium marinum (strain ATCC 25205 / DSM 745 / LMG 13164 / NCIMB 1802) TaxID=880070 RepID=G0J7M8_CYCMS|nr:hypothetical protein [Cyclobacterium marinum]AEL26981.1 hypothetical protein Cycma_3253 [Cyclobacterium marinum DSM 745]
MNIFKAFFLVTGMILSSCDDTLGTQDYLDWAQDSANGMKAEISDGRLIYTLQYQPPEMVYLMRYREDGADKTVREERLKQISTLRHYILKIGLSNGKGNFLDLASTEEEKQRLVYYLSYPFQNDIALMGSHGWQSPVLYHFERSMDMKASRTFVLGFENDENYSGMSVIRVLSPDLGINEVLLETNENHTKKPKL